VNKEESMQTLVAYVENKPGVLNRVASLTRRLAINIDSLTVGPTENVEIARMTICAHTDESGARRLEASLEKLVDVLVAENISDRSMLERDLALIKVAADHMNRPHLMDLVKAFRGRVVDVSPESVIVEVSDTTEKIDGLLEVLRPFGVLEMGRTGRIAMTKGNDVLRPPTAAESDAKQAKAKEKVSDPSHAKAS
jgi:acetolactate synthase-1/3 small subunit